MRIRWQALASLTSISMVCSFSLSACVINGINNNYRFERSKWQLETAHQKDALSFVADFYGSSWSVGTMKSKLRDLAPQSKKSVYASLMRAHYAELAGDDHLRWKSFLQAAAKSQTALARLFLWEAGRRTLTTSQKRQTLDFLRLVSEQHPDPDTRAYAVQAMVKLLKRFGDIEAARDYAAQLGYIQEWKSIGSFDNDQGKGLYSSFAPEEHIDYQHLYKGKLHDIRWRNLSAQNSQGILRLNRYYTPQSWSVAYLLQYVHSPKARTVFMKLTTSDPIRVWINDAVCASDELIGRGAMDNVVIKAQLQAGWNKLLIKTANKTGPWYVAARITDLAGRVAKGLQYSISPKGYTKAKTSGEYLRAHYINTSKLELMPKNLQTLLTSRLYLMHGRHLKAKQHLQPVFLNNSHNAVLMKQMASLYWMSGEQGKAIDILNRAIRDFKEQATYFYLARVKFYLNKQMYDKALADLIGIRQYSAEKNSVARVFVEFFQQRAWFIDQCRMLKQMLADEQDDAWLHRQLGLCYQARELPEEAYYHLKSALALEPGYIANIHNLMRYEQNTSRLKRVIQRLEHLRYLEPDNARYLIELGDVYHSFKNTERARKFYEEALTINPDWAKPQQRLGILAYEKEDKEQAIEHWRKALELNPDNTRLANYLDFLQVEKMQLLNAYIPADTKINEVLQQEYTAHPASHIIYLLDDEVSLVHKDGSAKRVVTQVVKAVNERGRDMLIRNNLPRSGNVRILQAYSRNPDGSRQEASSVRNRSIRFRNLELNSMVVLQYIHHAPAQPFLHGHYSSPWFFQGLHQQHINARWTVLAPKQKSLRFKKTEHIEVTTKEEGDYLVYTFTAPPLDPIIAEPYMPPMMNVLEFVLVGSLHSWDEFVQWEQGLLSDVFQEDEEIAGLARRLTDGQTDKIEQLNSIYQFVNTEIRYQQDYENTIAGVKPHTGPMIIERGYGDCKDKTVLLMMLARAIGIDTRFALVRTRRAGKIVQKIPGQQFNHAIVYIPMQAGIEDGFFMDATADGLDLGNLRADVQGTTSLVLEPKTGDYEFIEIPYYSPKHETVHHQISISIEPDLKASAKDRITIRGAKAAQLRKLMRSEDKADKILQAMAASLFFGASLEHAQKQKHESIKQPLEISLALDISRAIQPQGKQWRLKLPQLIPLSRVVQQKKRQNDLVLGPPEKYHMQVIIGLPAQYKFDFIPASMNYNRFGFAVQREVKRTEKGLQILFEYQRNVSRVERQEYPEFRSYIQKLINQANDPILFSRRPKDAVTMRTENPKALWLK